MGPRIGAALLAAALLLASVPAASAKTLESAKGERIFFYAADADGAATLLKTVSLDELKNISHGQLSGLMDGSDTGKNYYISSTDNYPTTQYCEARGITVPELVSYVKGATGVRGASSIGFSGSDAIRLMATDSYGNYNRSWTYDELYGEKRYYFEGLFDEGAGWKTAWEIAGEDDSKFGLGLDGYNARYRATDPYYAEKRAVFEGGVPTVPILATESFSGRTTSRALVASTEMGIAEYIERNGGVAAGSLKGALEDTWSLRLSLPMTEADLMAAHRTAFDNFKWIYNLRLDMASPPAFRAAGRVAEPVASVALSGGTLSISMSCETPGAEIYYSFDGAPQTPYTKPVTVDVAGRDLAADPVTFYMAAVREGYADAGVITAKYPGLAPAFKTLYSAMAGQELRFEAADGVSQADWDAWTGALGFISAKSPGAGGYTRLDAGGYRVDGAARAIVFGASTLSEPGSYSLIFHAAGYADKTASLTAKRPAPDIEAKGALIGRRVVFSFPGSDYQDGLALYVRPPGGESALISSNWLDRSHRGRAVLKAGYFGSLSCPIDEPGEYAFSLVNSLFEPGAVELALKMEDGGPLPAFDDVKAESWHYEAVMYAMSEGLLDPVGDSSFGPDGAMTRAMLVTALHRLEGSPDAAEYAGFTDVAQDGPLSAAVSWAHGAGVVNGMGDGSFAPDGNITREQTAAMLYRYARHRGADVSESGDLTAFSDAGSVSAWAREALAWANGAGIINGMGDGALAPQGGATRAQAATMLMNWDLR
ncbi:MAG: S-layer homology domain-containing protein [Clostridiales Family XIII bacterium]|jgi:hypothetical protein|nr:S-layer homology domain-containing protein [Clostridiales Family XIII bacterium]